ncbi:hypothetical protein [Protaetiibacter larvae]|uniref:HK97 gp10 family phage protein n=1 Tax=Protaetiibacter larvae TaxID=2592654 RepID=A0A5C1Y7L1_9MICO|nr:hypothetical protein [Protaetiibacter larvae]QEO08887.1 hypothetical protein FLP23_01930 [Protaetiibacter larvae]
MLDVRRSRELQAALLSIKAAEREVRLNINKRARTELRPVWTEALLGHALTRLEVRAIVPGARIAVGARNIRAYAATSTRPLRGGLVPAINFAPIEWGAKERKRKLERTSRLGRRHTATITVGRQFRPRTREGYIASPAAASVIHRAIAGWVGVIVDEFSQFADVTPRGT